MKFAATQTLCLLLVSTIASTTRAQVSCKAGKFERGERGNVTCHFGHDVRDSQSNFNVVQYSSKPGDSGNYVLLCNWQDKAPQCKVEDGYAFDQQASQSVVVDIPKVTNNMAGMYACQIVPDDGKGITTCNLFVTETTTQIITTIADPSQTTSYAVPKILSQASNDNQSSNKGNPNLGIIAALAVFVVATVALGTFLIVIRWKCSLKRRSELLPGEHDAWNDVICCRPPQHLTKSTERSAEAPENKKLNPDQRDRSAAVDDVDTDEHYSTGSFVTASAKRHHKSSQKNSTPPEHRAAAMTPHTPPANTSVPATSSPSATTKSPPVSSHFERPPMTAHTPKVAENKDLSSANKSTGQPKPTYVPDRSSTPVGLHHVQLDPLMGIMPSTYYMNN